MLQETSLSTTSPSQDNKDMAPCYTSYPTFKQMTGTIVGSWKCYECNRVFSNTTSHGHNEDYKSPEQLAEEQKAREIQFFADRRNHAIQMEWKKKYQRKTYANYRFR